MLSVSKVLREFRQVQKIIPKYSRQICTRDPDDADIRNALKRAFKADISEFKVVRKTSGYVGDVQFVRVKIGEKTHNLAVKIGKTDEESNRLMPISEACEREMLFYQKIAPAFYRFQEEKNISDPFTAAPTCYNNDAETNVILLEDLSYRGFEMHEPTKPLNVHHLKLVLKSLAKFHGLALAMRDQKPEVFDKFALNDAKHIYKSKLPALKETYERNVANVMETLGEVGRQDLRRKYAGLVQGGVGDIFLEIFDANPKEKVVNHCDCHNNNLFFKYRDASRESPIDLVIVDYQICCVHSPIMDLSYFLYIGASKNEIPHLVDLLKFYHRELSSIVRQLDSDPEKLFPISTLWDHWERYSRFGFLMSTMFMEVLLFERAIKTEEEAKENAPRGHAREIYKERLRVVAEHFLNNKLGF